jgi:hypothetical protein
MDTVELLGSTLGLGFLAGIRLYATVLLIGLVVRFHLIQLPPNLAHLSILGHNWILITAAAGCVMEFLADKIPWVDSLWDSVHTFIRPAGAILLGATALGTEDPVTRTVIALLCGGVALTGHSSKAATRLLVNHSPEPFSNMVLSAAEDLMIPAGIWLTMKHPVFTFSALAVFIAAFSWLSPRIFRSLRIECLAIGSLFTRFLSRTAMSETPACIRCAAGRGVPGLYNSLGKLCLDSDALVFSTRRMFRNRIHRIALKEIEGASLDRGLLVDTLVLNVGGQKQLFDVFKMHSTQQPEWFRAIPKARADSPSTSSWSLHQQTQGHSPPGFP